MPAPWKLRKPTTDPIPVLVTVPHCGTAFPTDLQPPVAASHQRDCPDTDWFVHELVAFTPDLGAPLLTAHWHRYVVDLNRDPAGKALYHDGRPETGPVPLRTFNGQPVYAGEQPGEEEVRSRVRRFHAPWYHKVGEILGDLQNRHGRVILFDVHSIRRHVPAIRPGPFPDVILSNANDTAADPELFSAVCATADRVRGLPIARNHPFRGGFQTRHWGDPAAGIHAIQVEMSQDTYMDEQENRLIEDKATKVRDLLRAMLTTMKTWSAKENPSR